MFGGGILPNLLTTVAPPGGGDEDIVQLVTTTVSQSIDYKTSDPVLNDLEERIRSWLSHGVTPSPRTQPTRVTKLYRSPTVEVQKRTVVVHTRPNNYNVDQSSPEPSSGQPAALDQSTSEQKEEVATWVESLEEKTTLPNINVTARSTTRRSRGSSKGSSLTSEDDDDRIMFDGASWV
ncbi:hypothetical protein LSAT2_006068 [Lamellibrachia satsuma]|nr:hypothetical protein LSAT2_006068 [Lamellibrachia satsuma]